MIHFEGLQSFTVPPEAVFPKIADAAWLAAAVPEATVTSATADKAEWKVKPKFSFLSGSLDTSFAIVQRQPPNEVKYRIEAKGIGNGCTVEATARLEGDGAGTKLNWVGDVIAMSGLLKLAPKGLVKATAEKVIADLWTAIRPKIEAG